MSSAKAMAQAQFQSLTAERLDAVLAVEQRAYAHPWNRSHFLDALQAGYQAQMLVADDALLGYFVAMEGFEEVHLLNITVAPEYRGQGWSRVMLDALTLWARGRTAQWLWLEVRVGNDGEPAVGVTLQVIDLSSGAVVWSASGAKSGWSREALSVVANKVMENLLAGMPASAAKH